MVCMSLLSLVNFILAIRSGIKQGDLDYMYLTDIVLQTLIMVIFFLGSYLRYQELLDIGISNPSFSKFVNAKLFIYMGLIVINLMIGLLLIYQTACQSRDGKCINWFYPQEIVEGEKFPPTTVFMILAIII